MNQILEARLAEAILDRETFTADDVTDEGRIALDARHGANARQNGIGSLFNEHARAGHIAFTGRVERSRAPHRKGGAVRVWTATGPGRLWAELTLGRSA